MTNTQRKNNSAYSGPYPGSDMNEFGQDRTGGNFDLRDTLGETQVREVSLTEFLAALKQAGKYPA